MLILWLAITGNSSFFFLRKKYVHSTLDILALSKISNGHFFFILQRICIIPSALSSPFRRLHLRTFFDTNKRLRTEPRAVTGFLLFFLLERGYHKNSQPLTFIRLSCRQNLPTFFLLLSNRNQGVKRRICHTQCRHSNIHRRIGARNTGKSEKGRVQRQSNVLVVHSLSNIVYRKHLFVLVLRTIFRRMTRNTRKFQMK